MENESEVEEEAGLTSLSRPLAQKIQSLFYCIQVSNPMRLKKRNFSKLFLQIVLIRTSN